MTSPLWTEIRAEFPALARWVYLNTATYGQVPRRAAQAVARHFAHRDELACDDFLSWFDDADRLRGLLAKLIHCEADDIGFVSSAASALSFLLGGLRWRPGDRIVTLPDEFPNNIYHPALLAQSGVEMAEVPWERFFEAIDSRTRLVAMSTVNYMSGFRPPLREVSRFLRERGVLFYLDGTQSLGALDFDVREIQPDMLAVHGYKWLLAPNGAAFFYIHPRLRELLPPSVVGWRSHVDWRSVDHLHHGAPQFKSSAEKYEGGMLVFPVLYAMEESVRMILEIGPAVIEARVLGLAAYARERLRALGASFPEEHAGPAYRECFTSPIVAARFNAVDASVVARRLRERHVLLSARHGNLRVSTHFYNNEADVDCLERELRELLPAA